MMTILGDLDDLWFYNFQMSHGGTDPSSTSQYQPRSGTCMFISEFLDKFMLLFDCLFSPSKSCLQSLTLYRKLVTQGVSLPKRTLLVK